MVNYYKRLKRLLHRLNHLRKKKFVIPFYDIFKKKKTHYEKTIYIITV